MDVFNAADFLVHRHLSRGVGEKTALSGAVDRTYREFDPDQYGEELANAVYDEVERLALVTLTVTRP